MLYLIIRSLTIVLFKIFFRLQAFAQENIPLRGGVIIASNHRSYLDPPILAAACPRIVSFLAKEEIFRNPIFGRFIRALNAFPLKTNSVDIRSLRWAIEGLQAGKVLIVFPEGRRVAEGERVEAMKGVGLLAAKAACPIVPAFIQGSDKALPIHARFIRMKKIKIYFGRPILAPEIASGLNREELYQAITERTMEEIRHLKDMANDED